MRLGPPAKIFVRSSLRRSLLRKTAPGGPALPAFLWKREGISIKTAGLHELNRPRQQKGYTDGHQ
jgi:hypothetical protein